MNVEGGARQNPKLTVRCQETTASTFAGVEPIRHPKARSPLAKSLGYIAVGFSAIPGGLFLAKISALTVGPKGLGTIAALQAVSVVVTLLADANVGQGFIRKALEEPARFAQLAAAARLITRYGAGFMILVCLLLAPLVGQSIVGGDHPTLNFALAGVAGGLTMVSIQEVNILSARRNDRRVIQGLFLQGFVGPVVAGLSLIVFRESLAGCALMLAALAVLLCRMIVVRDSGARVRAKRNDPETRRAIRELLVIGGPLSMATVLGTGSVALVPIIIRMFVGSEETGYFRAAALVSGGYTAGLLTLLARSYYPKLAAETDVALLCRAIENQVRRSARSICLMAVAIVFVAPAIIRLMFSGEFGPSATVLKLIVIGDVLKFVAWSLTFAVLARLSPQKYVHIEIFGAVVLLLLVSAGGFLGGLRGAGAGLVAAYACYLAFALHVVVRGLALTLRSVVTTEALIGCVLVAAAGLVAGADTLTVLERLPVALVIFGVATHRLWAVAPINRHMLRSFSSRLRFKRSDP